LRKAKGEPKRPTLPSHVICISRSAPPLGEVDAALAARILRRLDGAAAAG
jgi:hypothetical protein